MFRRPVKTYLRKPTKPMTFTSIAPVLPSVPRFSDSDDEADNTGQNDDMEDTFDKIRKTARPVEPPPADLAGSPFTSSDSSSSDTDVSELEAIPIPQSFVEASPKRGRKRKPPATSRVESSPQKMKKAVKPKASGAITSSAPVGKLLLKHKREKKGLKKKVLSVISSSSSSSEDAESKKNEPNKIGTLATELKNCYVNLTPLNHEKAPVAEKAPLDLDEPDKSDELPSARKTPLSADRQPPTLSDSSQSAERSANPDHPSIFNLTDDEGDPKVLQILRPPPKEFAMIPKNTVTVELKRPTRRRTTRSSKISAALKLRLAKKAAKSSSPLNRKRSAGTPIRSSNEAKRRDDKMTPKVKEAKKTSDPLKDCWVKVHKLQLHDKENQESNVPRKSSKKFTAGPQRKYKSSNPSPPVSSPGQQTEEKVQDLLPNELPKPTITISEATIPQDESKSIFSDTSSPDPQDSLSGPQPKPQEDPKPVRIQFKMSDDDGSTKNDTSIPEIHQPAPSSVVTNRCSVALRRLEEAGRNLGDVSLPRINQTLLSSTPLVSRIGLKGVRIHLSPISNDSLTNALKGRQNNLITPNKSKTDTKEKSKSIATIQEKAEVEVVPEKSDKVKAIETAPADEAKKRLSSKENDRGDNSVIVVNSCETSDASISIVECTERPHDVGEDMQSSLKGRIAKHLFSDETSIENPQQSGVDSSREPEKFAGEDNNEDNSPVNVETASESSLQLSDKENYSKNTSSGVSRSSKSASSSADRMSPLLFEGSDEDTQNATEKSKNVSINEEKEEVIIDPTLEKRESNQRITMSPSVLLTQLNDPIRVTDRRNRYRNWENRLSAINENANIRVSGAPEQASVESVAEASRDTKLASSLSVDQKDEEADSVADVKPVVLKPGKSWARSLSILNNIQNKDDIELLAAGKGQKWRHSVMSVLNMQHQGIVQSCTSKNENDKDDRASRGLPEANVSTRWLPPDRRTIHPSSPGRFVRRLSIRVVPDTKGSRRSVVRPVEDSPFLEAYGITPSRDRQTLVKKPLASPKELSCGSLSDFKISPATARRVVLDRCGQRESRPFSTCYSREYLSHCCKIGEGVYGEVFLFDDGKEKSVIKIIPIEGAELVNGEPQKKFDEILSEIIIAKELHDLRSNEAYRTDGFVQVKDIRCLVGKYPEELVALWKAYDEEKKSDNDCPSMFNEEQLYVALELGDGGKDLEGFVFQNASEAHSAFIQTALTLAVAERSLDFEHRDLHWGNILISRTSQVEASYRLNDKEVKFPCQSIKVSVIDFTLSRMSYQGCCIFNDLALDPSLFTAVGEYQFEIYRLMRAKVGNDWQRFEPYTNVLWLHYALDKMITAVRYKRRGTKVHKTYIQKLRELKDVILDYESAFEFVTSCEIVRDLLNTTLP